MNYRLVSDVEFVRKLLGAVTVAGALAFGVGCESAPSDARAQPFAEPVESRQASQVILGMVLHVYRAQDAEGPSSPMMLRALEAARFARHGGVEGPIVVLFDIPKDDTWLYSRTEKPWALGEQIRRHREDWDIGVELVWREVPDGRDLEARRIEDRLAKERLVEGLVTVDDPVWRLWELQASGHAYVPFFE